jgi:peptidylprolyl isomerase
MLDDGVRIEADLPGDGALVIKGAVVTIRCRTYLNQGDLVNDVEQRFEVGRRQVVAGLERGIVDMRVGGRRRLWVSPHLAYREVGVPGLVPPNAVLRFEVEVLAVEVAAQPGPGDRPGERGA